MTSGYTPVPCEHFAGLALDWPPEMVIPAGAPVAENVEITEAGVGRREGLSKVFDLAQPVAAMASLGPGTPAVALFGAGAFGAETEAGNGELSNRGNPATVPAPIRPAVIYGRVYIPNPDGSTGLATGLLPYYYDGTEANPVNPPLPTPNLAPGDSGTAGNIAAGLRYVICLLKMPDGSLMLCPGIGSWTAAGGHEALIGGLPTSFFETTPVAVILAFTVAGGSSAGPFFYIAEGQTVNGVVETSTVSEGDSAASITVNFDDSFLASSTDVTEYLRQIALPSEAAVAYSRLTDRLMWWGEQGQPSLLRLSEPGDAGLYLGDTGFVLVADEDGQSNRAAFEFRGGLYVAKDHSLYRVTPNNGDPATWNVSQVSASVGCCGPMAFADGGDFMLLLGRGGLHLFSGGATQWVSKMLNGADEDHPGIWERINWAEAWRFWVHIDHERKVARCGVALDGATSPSHILRFSYRDGWEGSLRYSAFTGRPHFWPGLRASVDTIAATGCWTIPRTAQLPQVPLDRRMAESQVLLGLQDRIGTPDPGADDDCGAPIPSRYRTGAISAAEKVAFEHSGMQFLGLVQARLTGSGPVEIWAIAGPAQRLAATVEPQTGFVGDARGLALLAGESVHIEIRSAARWFCSAIYGWAKTVWGLRAGPVGGEA